MFNLFSSTTPDGVAIVSAFLSGVAIMIIGAAAGHYIKQAVKDLFNPKHQMARRNK